eukprot:SM000002S05698  [mRNA]  locus=s2:1608455:1609788:- [translate_table: standard]
MAAEKFRDPHEEAALQPAQAEAMVGCNEEGSIANASLDASRKRALGREEEAGRGRSGELWSLKGIAHWFLHCELTLLLGHKIGSSGSSALVLSSVMCVVDFSTTSAGVFGMYQELNSATCQRQLLEMQFKGGSCKGYTRGRVPDGQGELSLPDGSRYKGEWSNGAKDGIGQLWEANGDVVCGTWKQDLQHGEVHGKGKYTFANGSSDIGEFQNSERHGIGFYTSNDGARLAINTVCFNQNKNCRW